jgi:hypothetical protein
VEVERLAVELVQGDVAIEALRVVGAKKDVWVLQLQHKAEAMCTDVEGELQLLGSSFVDWVC